jgi:hypothetical protein
MVDGQKSSINGTVGKTKETGSRDQELKADGGSARFRMGPKMSENEAWPELSFRCDGGGCVIVEATAAGIVIRDSKNPARPGLVFSRSEYADFRRRVRGDARPR